MKRISGTLTLLSLLFHAIVLAQQAPSQIPAQEDALALLRATLDSESGSASMRPPKCGTALMWQVREQMAVGEKHDTQLLKVLGRPTGLKQEHVSPSGFFRVHFTVSGPDAVSSEDNNGNGIPDYVEEVAEAFETSFRVEVDELGYEPPPQDNDSSGPEYDVYINALGTGVYGLTTREQPVPGTPENDFTSFIQVDNDFENGQFTTGLPGMRVTAAHELFHAIQFGYRDAIVVNDFFYYELCSSWIEDVIYDDINDYYSNVPTYLTRSDRPFNQFDGATLFNYGAALWNRLLVRRFQNREPIRRSWELMAANTSVLDAIAGALAEIGGSFDDEFGEFSVWNYFTGNRADPVNYYEEGNAYTQVRLSGNFLLPADTTLAGSSFTLSHQYFRLTASQAGEYLVVPIVSRPDAWRFAAVLEDGSSFRTVAIDAGNGGNIGFVPAFSSVVVVVANLTKLDGSRMSLFESERSEFQLVLSNVTQGTTGVAGITTAYPNPFRVATDGQIVFEFEVTATTDLRVQIMDSQGRVVRSAALGQGALTPSRFVWDGRDDTHSKVGSGIYIFRLAQGGFTELRKFAVIRD